MILQELTHDLDGVPEIKIDPTTTNDIETPNISFDEVTDSRIPEVIIYCNKNDVMIDKLPFDGFVNRFFDGIREHTKYRVIIGDDETVYELDEEEVENILSVRHICRNNHPSF